MGGDAVVVRLGQDDLSNLGQIVAATGLDVQARSVANGVSGRITGTTFGLALTGAADNTGAIEATGDLTLTAASLANAGSVVANGAGTVTLSGALTNSGKLVAQSLTVGTGGDLGNTGFIVAKGPGALTLTVAGRVDNAGSLLAQAGDLTLTAGGVVASTGDIIAKGRLALTAAAYEATSDQAGLGGDAVVVRLGQGHLLNLGQIVAATGLDVQAGDLNNGVSGRIAGTGVGIALSGAATNGGRVESSGILTLTAASLANAGTVVAAGRDPLTLTIAGRIDNTGSLLALDGDLTLTAGGIVTSTGDIIASGRFALSAAGYEATSDKARLGGDGVVMRLGAGHLVNLGQIVAAAGLDVQAGTFDNGAAARISGTTVNLALAGAAANGGAIEATGDLLLTVGSLTNAGSVVANGAGTVTLSGALDNSGKLVGNTLTAVTGGDLGNTGFIVAKGPGALTLTVAGRVDNAGSLLAQAGDLILTAGGVVASTGDVIASGRLALTAAGYEATSAQAGLGGNAVLVRLGQGQLLNLGQIIATTGLDVQAGDLDNGTSGRIAAADIGLALSGAATNAGRIEAGATFSLSATRFSNVGSLSTKGDLTLTFDEVIASTGAIIAGGRLALTAAGYEATSDKARLGGDAVVIRLGRGHLLNLGQIVAATRLDVQAGTLESGDDARISGAGVELTLSGTASNRGAIEATGDLTLTAASLANAGTVVAHGVGAITLAGALDNDGKLVARTLTLVTGADLANTGVIAAKGPGALALTVAGRLDNAGSLLAQDGDLTLTAGGSLSSAGDIIAGGRLALTAAGYAATSDKTQTGGATVVIRLGGGDLSNLGQIVAAAGLDVQAASVANGVTGRIAGATVGLALTAAADNKGAIEATGDLTLSATGLTNGGTIVTDGAGTLILTGALDNGGKLVAQSLVVGVGGDLGNTGLIIGKGPGALALTVAGRVDNAGALLAQAGDLTLTAGGLGASTGDIIASGRLALTAAGYAATSDGARMGGDAVVLRLGQGDLSNLGQIAAATGLDVRAGTLANGATARITGTTVGLALAGGADNQGAIEATGDLTLTATSLGNAGTVVTNGAGTITLAGGLGNSGKLVGNTLTVGIGGDLGNTGFIAAKGPGTLALTVAGRVDNNGSMLARDGDLTLIAGGVVASTGDVIASGRLALTAAGYAATSDQARMGGDAVVVRLGQGDLSNLGLIEATAGLDVQAGSLDNGASGRIVGAGIGLALTGAATNGGRIEASADLTLTATSLTNAGTAVAGGSATLTLAGRVENTGHLVAKGGDLALTAGGVVTSTGDLIAGGGLALTAAGYAATSDGARTGGNAVVVRLGGGDLSNLGLIVAATGLDVKAGTLENGDKARIAGAGVGLALGGAADNRGAIEATGDLTLTAASLANAGTVVADGTGTLILTGALTNGGKIVGGSLTIGVGSDLGNTGSIAAKGPGALTLTVAGRVDNGGSLLTQAGDLTLTAGGAVVSTGDIIASGGLTLRAAGYAATSDAARMGGNAVVIRLGQGDLSNLGVIVATAGLDVTAGTLENGASGRIAGAGVGLALGGAADNRGAIEATGDLTLTAASLANSGTVVADGAGTFTLVGGLGNSAKIVGGSLTVGVGSDLGNTGSIGAKGPGALTLTVVGRVDNGGSLLAQAGDMTLTAGGAVASTGDIIAKGHLALTAASYAATSDAARMGGGDIVVRLGQGDLSNLGVIVATAGLDVKAGTLENGASGRIAGTGVGLALGGAADNRGTIEATGDLTLIATDLANAGTVVADGTGTVTLSGAVGNGGKLLGKTLTIGTGGDLANTGVIVAKGPGALTLTVAGRADNAGSLLAQAGDLTLTAGGAVASTGDIIASGGLTLTAASYAATSDQARMGGNAVVIRLGQGDLSNLGVIVATAGLDVQAGTLENGDKARIAGTTVGLAFGGAADNRGAIEATGDLTLSATNLGNAGTVVADGTGALTVEGVLTNSGKIVGATLTVGVGSDLGNSGSIGAKGPGGLILKVAGRVDNGGSLLAQAGDLTLTAGGAVASTADIIASGGLTLTAASYAATSDGARMGGNAVIIRLGQGDLSNLGVIVATAGLDVQAGTLENGDKARIAGATVGLVLTGAADNRGTIEATGDLTFSSVSLGNTGAILANGAGTLTLPEDFTNGGRVEFSRDGSVTAASYGGLADSRLRARNLTLAIGAGLSNAGEISAGGLLDVKAGSLGNGAAGRLAGNATKLVIGGDLGNGGTISAVDFLSVTVGGALTNQGAITGMDLLLGVGGGIRNEGRIAAVGTLTATGASLDNLATGAISGNSASLTLTGAVANAGAISSDDTLVIKGASLANAGTATATATLSAARLTLEVAGNLGNGPYASIAGSQLASISAATTDLDLYGVNDVAHGQFTFGGDLGLTLTNGGLIVAKGQSLKAEHGALALSVSGDLVIAGTIVSQGDLTLISGGNIAVGRVTTVTFTPSLAIGGPRTFKTLEEGEVFTTGNGRIEAAGDLTNTASLIQASGSLAIKVGGTLTNTRMEQTLSNYDRYPTKFASKTSDAEKYVDVVEDHRDGLNAAQIVAGGDLSIEAGNVLNDASIINAGGLLQIKADAVENRVRGTYVYSTTIKVGGSKDTVGNKIRWGLEEDVVWTNALLEGDGGVNINARALINNTKLRSSTGIDIGEHSGTITGPTVTINASVVVNGPSSGSVTAPAARLTSGTIDLVGAAEGGSVGSNGNLGAAGGGAGPAGQRVDDSASGGSLNGGALNDQAAGGQLTPSGIAATGASAGPLASNDGAGAPGHLGAGAIGTTATGGRLSGASGSASAGRHSLKGGTVTANAAGGSLNGSAGGTGGTLLTGGTVSATATGGRLTASGGTTGAGGLTGSAVSANVTGGQIGADGVASPNAAGFPRPVAAADSTARAAGIAAPASGARGGSASSIVYLRKAPLAGATERGPDWILDQVGDTRSRQGLTVFADPTTEEGLIRTALVAKIGRSLLDPSYTNAERQREILYQGTVDYLKAHPEVRLGDRLSDAQKAALTAPMLWYESRVIDGQSTLVPVLLLPEGDLGRYSQAAGGGILGGNILIKADQVTNTGTILATGHLTIDAGTILNEQLTATAVTVGPHGTYTQTTLQEGGTLAGGTVAITTRGDFTSVNGRIQASGALSLSAGGTVALLAQQTGASFDETSHHVHSQGQTVTNVGTEVLAGTGLSITGGNILLQASHLAARTVDLRADGTLAFLTGHDVASSQVSGTKTGLFTQRILDHGRSDESLVYTRIDGALSMEAGRTVVEYEAGQDVRTGTGKKTRFDHLVNAVDGDASPRAVVSGLSAQPGLGWMAQVAQGDIPVSYVGLTTQHRQWNNDTTVLSPAARAMIVVAVALATQGFGAAAFAAVAESAAAAATAAGLEASAAAVGSAAAAAAAASTSSLISGTLIGAIDGHLDVGSLFLNAALAAASAGVLNFANTQLLPQVGDALGLQKMTTDGGASFGLGNPAVPSTQTFEQVVQNGFAKLAVDAPIRAGVQALAGGGSFGKALLASLKSGVAADVVEPALFYGVGDLGVSQGLSDGGLGKIALHAAVGAGGGYLTGGERGAVGGALGSGLSEAVSPLAQGLTPQDQQNLAQLLGSFGSFLAGDASMAGSASALNGLQYNRQLHPLEATLIRDNAARYAVQRGFCPSVEACSASDLSLARSELTLQAVRDVDVTGKDNPYNDAAEQFLVSLGKGKFIEGSNLTDEPHTPTGVQPIRAFSTESILSWLPGNTSQYYDSRMSFGSDPGTQALYAEASKQYNSEHIDKIDIYGGLLKSAAGIQAPIDTAAAVDRSQAGWEWFAGLTVGAGTKGSVSGASQNAYNPRAVVEDGASVTLPEIAVTAGGHLTSGSGDGDLLARDVPSVIINRTTGNAFRDEIAELFRKNGYDVRKEFYKATPFGGRYIDIELSKDGTLLGGIETKYGSYKYTSSQRSKDNWLRMQEPPYIVDVVRDK